MTKTEINVFIYLVGDYAAQTEWGKKHWLDFDVWRTVRNGAIGAFFGPLVSVYYDFSDLILPPEVLSNAPKKIFMDQTVYLATKCSVYIMLVGMLAGRSFNDCFDDVKSRIWTIMSRAWRFWPFVHCITYSVIPPAQRILWVNCVDIVWSSILASITADEKSTVESESLLADEGGCESSQINVTRPPCEDGAELPESEEAREGGKWPSGPSRYRE